MKTIARPWNEAAAGVIGSSRPGRLWRRWLPAWLGLAGLAVLNGVGRQALYAETLGDLRAHQLSTATLVVIVGGYVWVLERRWPLPSEQAAVAVGGVWTTLTLAFELGAGHYVFGSSWERLLADYNLLDGRVWVLVPLWVLVAPALIRHIHR